MNITISNEFISLTVSPLGAEMQSIRDADGHEYLWQGSEVTWKNKAPNLFPWIARLTQGKYTYDGVEYHMESHGFAAASVFDLRKIGETELCCTLESNAATLQKYPFHFIFTIIYTLKEKTIDICCHVKNEDEKTMFFGLGGHPGFIVPMEVGEEFSDYSLIFSEKATPVQVGMSEDCFVTCKDVPFPLKNGDTLPLRQDLFDHDAIILKNTSGEVTLRGKGPRRVTVTYPHSPYLGIWNWPKKDVNYICIEPWTALPARKNIVEEVTTKPDFQKLPAGQVYSLDWKISL
ncbi:MAG: aldose 1-epimerase family protein [Oscillospiraceae bacterium]